MRSEEGFLASLEFLGKYTADTLRKTFMGREQPDKEAIWLEVEKSSIDDVRHQKLERLLRRSKDIRLESHIRNRQANYKIRVVSDNKRKMVMHSIVRMIHQQWPDVPKRAIQQDMDGLIIHDDGKNGGGLLKFLEEIAAEKQLKN